MTRLKNHLNPEIIRKKVTNTAHSFTGAAEKQNKKNILAF